MRLAVMKMFRMLATEHQRLPEHSRVEHPLLAVHQVVELWKQADEWGTEAVSCEHFLQDMQDLPASLPATHREVRERLQAAEAKFREALVYALQTQESEHTCKQLVEEVMEAARYWVDWRVRGARDHAYGKCALVIERAEWALQERLLTLQSPVCESENQQE